MLGWSMLDTGLGDGYMWLCAKLSALLGCGLWMPKLHFMDKLLLFT